MKKYIIILISLILSLFSSLPVFADISSDNIQQLSLDTAYEMLEKNNQEIKLLDEKIFVYKRQYDVADEKKDTDGSLFSNDKATNVQYRKAQLLDWKKALYDLNNIKKEREDKLNSLKLELKKQYFEALMLQEDVKNLENEIDYINKKIDTMNLKLKLGQTTENSIKDLQIQKMQLQTQMNSILKQYNTALLNIKNYIGIDLNKEITLVPVNITYQQFDDSDIENRISYSAQNCYDVQKCIQELELAQIEYNIYYNNYDEDSSTVMQAELSVKEKEISLQTTKSSAELSLWNAYYNLKNLEDNIEIEKLNTENALNNLNLTEANLKIGKATIIDEINAKNNYLNQQITLQRAIIEYQLACESFQQKILK